MAKRLRRWRILLLIAMPLILSACGDLPDTIANEVPWREAFYVTIDSGLLSVLANMFYMLTIPPLLILTLAPLFNDNRWGLPYSKGIGLMLAAAITPMVFTLLTTVGQRMFFPDGLDLSWVADLMGWTSLLEGDANPVTVKLAFGFTQEIPNYYKIWEMLLGFVIIILVAISVINVSFKPILMGWVLAGAWAMFPMAFYTLVTEFGEGRPGVIEATLQNYNGSYLIAVGMLFITMTVVPVALMIVFAPALGFTSKGSKDSSDTSTSTTAETSVVENENEAESDGRDTIVFPWPFDPTPDPGEDDNTATTGPRGTSPGPSGSDGGGPGGAGGSGGPGGSASETGLDPDVVETSESDIDADGDMTDVDARTIVTEESSSGDILHDDDTVIEPEEGDETGDTTVEGDAEGDLDIDNSVLAEGNEFDALDPEGNSVEDENIEGASPTVVDNDVAVEEDTSLEASEGDFDGGDVYDIAGGVSVDAASRIDSRTNDLPDYADDTAVTEVSGESAEMSEVEDLPAEPDYSRSDEYGTDVVRQVSAPPGGSGEVETDIPDADVLETQRPDVTDPEFNLDSLVEDAHSDSPYVEERPRVEARSRSKPRVSRDTVRRIGEAATAASSMVGDPRAASILGIAGAAIDALVPKHETPPEPPQPTVSPPDLSGYDDDFVQEE